MFGFRAFGSHSHSHSHSPSSCPVGVAIQNLLTQLQEELTRREETYEDVIRDHQAIELLSSISEKLSLVGNESELSGLRVSELGRTLVNLLGETSAGEAQDLQLLSARAMCNLCEVLPGSASVLVDCDGCIPNLLDKLTEIQSIDVAEQSVLALQKISRERGSAVLKGGGLAALLTFVDFFPQSVQRICFSTAAAIVQRVPQDCMEMVMQSIPLVRQKLENKSGLDENIHTAIILFFMRVTQAVTNAVSSITLPPSNRSSSASSSALLSSSSSSSSSVDYLTQLEQSGLLRSVVELLRHALKEPSLFSSSSLTHLLTILVTLVRKSSTVAEQLLSDQYNIVEIIHQVYTQITGNNNYAANSSRRPSITTASSSTLTPTSGAASSTLPTISPQLTSSPSMRSSTSTLAHSSQQLNPLLSLAIELLPDLRSRSISSASSLDSDPSTAGELLLDRANRQLRFLSPLLESSTTTSPDLLTEREAESMQLDPSMNSSTSPLSRRIRRRQVNQDDLSDEDEEEQFMASSITSPASASPPLTAVTSTPTAGTAESTPNKVSLNSSKATYFLSHSSVFHDYIRTVLPIFIHAANTTSDNHIRYKCVNGALRIMSLSDSGLLSDPSLFSVSQLSSFVHSMIHTHDPSIIGAAISLIDQLVGKCQIFGEQLYREGCVETIQEIADRGLPMNHSKFVSNSPNQSMSLSSAPIPINSSNTSVNQALFIQQQIQQRAKALLVAHFSDEANGEDDDDSPNHKDEASQPNTSVDSSSSLAAAATGMLDGSSSIGSPLKGKRRRFSSSATAVFKKAKDLASELIQLMSQHEAICKKVHQQPKCDTLDEELVRIEDSLLSCLRAICSCLVHSPDLASVAPVSPTTTPPSVASTPPADVLTTHELLQSGLVDTILAYIYNPFMNRESKLLSFESTQSNSIRSTLSDRSSSSDPWSVDWTGEQLCGELSIHRRQRIFCHAFFGLPLTNVKWPHTKGGDEISASTPLPNHPSIGDAFVLKLIEALESIDPIRPITSGINPVQALQMFTMPMRVRLTYKARIASSTNSPLSSHLGPSAPPSSSSKSHDPSPIPTRRSTRSMSNVDSSHDSTSKSRAASKSPSGKGKKKSGFLSNAFAAIKRRVSGSGSGSGSSSSPANPSTSTPSSGSSVHSFSTSGSASSTISSANLESTISSLYPQRQVHIDPLANFHSIESFLQESTSLVNLYEMTERVKSGKPANRSSAEIEAEAEALRESKNKFPHPTPPSTRSSSRNKSRTNSPKDDSEIDRSDELDHMKLLEGIRRARFDAQPIRVVFRFCKKSSQTTMQYSNHPSSHSTIFNKSSQPSPNDSDQDWIEISDQDRNMSLFEFVQHHHPLGFKQKTRPTENRLTSAAASSPAGATSPFSAYNMFHACYDIQFALTREPISSNNFAMSKPSMNVNASTSLASSSAQVSTPLDSSSSTPSSKGRSRRGSKAASKSQMPLKNETLKGGNHLAKANEVEEVKPTTNSEPVSSVDFLRHRLTQCLESAFGESSSRHLSSMSSILLLLDSLHHLSHHWSSLYSAWPEIVDFISSNDSAGHGSTGRHLVWPTELVSLGLMSNHSQLPYSQSFVSSKLSRQLQSQCEDSIIVLSKSMPAWVDGLVRTFPFLFNFSSRELLFRVTAFQPPRHLLAIHNHLMSSQPNMRLSVVNSNGPTGSAHNLVSRNMADAAASSDEEDEKGERDEFGIGTVEFGARQRSMHTNMDNSSGEEIGQLQPNDRIPQLKVRVHRDAVLKAARQLFLTHPATRRGALRAEFHGEEAVGIGPTLEFFSLVGQQLQLKSLGVWHKEVIRPAPTKSQSSTPPLPVDEDAMDVDEDVATPVSNTNHTSGGPTDDATTTRKVGKRKRQPSISTTQPSQTSPTLQADSKRPKKIPNFNIALSASSSFTSSSSSSSSASFPLRPSSPPGHLHHSVSSRLAEFFDMCVIQCPCCTVVEIPFCKEHQQFLTIRQRDGSWACAGQTKQGTSSSQDQAKSDPKIGSSKKKKRASLINQPSTSNKSSRSVDPVLIPCGYSTHSITSICNLCLELSKLPSGLPNPASTYSIHGMPPRRFIKHWRLHTEEADYVLNSYRSDTIMLSHIMLQCSTCLCVNFAGYRASSYGLADVGEGMLVTNKGDHMVTATNAIIQEKAYRTVTRHVTHACDGTQLNLEPIIITKSGVIEIIRKCKDATPHMQKKREPTQSATEKSLASRSSRSISFDVDASMDDSEHKDSSSATPMESVISPVLESNLSPQTDLTGSSLTRTVSSSATIPASHAFDQPTSQFTTSSALYQPPTVQSLSKDSHSPGITSGVIEWNWVVGRFLGQAIMEQRLIDIPFSQTLLRQLSQPSLCSRRCYSLTDTCKRGGVEIKLPHVEQQIAPSILVTDAPSISPPPPSTIITMLMDLLEISPHIAKPMLKMLAIAYHRFSPNIFPLPLSLQSVDGMSIASFEFDFTLPGHSEIELIPNGANVAADESNVHIWIWLVARQILHEGVLIQMHSFTEGLKETMDTARLQPFFSYELEELISGGGCHGSKLIAWDWSVNKLRSAIKFRQGYHPDSPAILNLLTILSELTPIQQRQFTRFITGSPSLPGGQIGALNPPLTVVKIDIKHDDKKDESSQSGSTLPSTLLSPTRASTDSADAITAAINSNYPLPSVMTCYHDLKLPNYPTLTIMREKIRIAITEGSTGFTLS